PKIGHPEYAVKLTLESKDSAYVERAMAHLLDLLPVAAVVRTEERRRRFGCSAPPSFRLRTGWIGWIRGGWDDGLEVDGGRPDDVRRRGGAARVGAGGG